MITDGMATWRKVFGAGLCMAVLLGVSVNPATSEEFSVPQFADWVFDAPIDQRGDIVVDILEDEKYLEMEISGRRAKRPRKGWGGVCIVNGTTAKLSERKKMFLDIEADVPGTRIEIKLEKTSYRDGTLWVHRGALLPTKRETQDYSLADGEDTSRRGDTLAKVKKICLFVTARGFPRRAEQVKIKVYRVSFR